MTQPRPQDQAPASSADTSQYREMIESVNSIILRWNSRLEIEFINRYGEQFLGFAHDELLGRSLLGTLVPDEGNVGRSLRRMLDDIIEHPSSYLNNENQNSRKDGTLVWLSWSNQPVYGADGGVAAILSVANDISALKAAQAEQLRLNRDLSRALAANDMLLRETEDLNHKLAELARTDQLTGLLNRRCLMDKLAEEYFRATRYNYPLGFLMLDIDHFKRINDEFGHDVGDIALKAVTAIIAKTVRQDDTVARFGGEEICVLLPYASAVSTWTIGERIRRTVEQETGILAASKQLPRAITLSAGGASTENPISSEEELLKCADEMLYLSKNQGRNRVSVHGFDLGGGSDAPAGEE